MGEGRCWWGKETERKHWLHPVSFQQLLSVLLIERSEEELLNWRVVINCRTLKRFRVDFELESFLLLFSKLVKESGKVMHL